MLWKTDILVSTDAYECESQYVLQQKLVRSLADLRLETELVLSPASEAGSAEVGLVEAASEPHRAAARTALRRAGAVATTHCNPGDQLSTLE